MTSDATPPSRIFYLELAAVLREQIRTGELCQGQELPSEPTLGAEHQVSRPVVRQALAVLRHEGLITTDRGRPSYVRKQPTRQPVDLQPGDEVIFRAPTADERSSMGLDPGVPLAEVRHTDGTVHLHRGDRVVVRPPATDRAAPR
jgi:DNA-binding transcriptional regulator YhcF (GntR family)